MFQDEGRFGRINKPKRCWCPKGVRPTVPCQIVREYTYAYSAVSPQDGKMVSLVLPYANTNCMNLFLEEVSNRFPNDHILMVWTVPPGIDPKPLKFRTILNFTRYCRIVQSLILWNIFGMKLEKKGL